MKAEHFELILRLLDGELGNQEVFITTDWEFELFHREEADRVRQARDAFIEEVKITDKALTPTSPTD